MRPSPPLSTSSPFLPAIFSVLPSQFVLHLFLFTPKCHSSSSPLPACSSPQLLPRLISHLISQLAVSLGVFFVLISLPLLPELPLDLLQPALGKDHIEGSAGGCCKGQEWDNAHLLSRCSGLAFGRCSSLSLPVEGRLGAANTSCQGAPQPGACSLWEGEGTGTGDELTKVGTDPILPGTERKLWRAMIVLDVDPVGIHGAPGSAWRKLQLLPESLDHC